MRFGGDERVEEVLRRRGDDYWTHWHLDEWKLATRVFIQPAPGMLKIS